MKQITIAVLSLVLSNSAVAAGAKYICKQTNDLPGYQKITAILEQNGNSIIKEGKAYPFTLELYQSGERKPFLKRVVFAQFEDVQFTFGNSSEGISGWIYLDELDQSGLNLKGEKVALDCE